MGTIVVLAGLAVVVGLVIRGMIRDKKQGRSGCGGDCSRCRGCH
ncbi:MAG: FeoB-associated Cys-rich membrane protein [Eubacterium sp.]|nr:FeoB-associated Cys-rich membrane protein [Eubacterium sp.]